MLTSEEDVERQVKGKAAGLDYIPVEVWICLGERTVQYSSVGTTFHLHV